MTYQQQQHQQPNPDSARFDVIPYTDLSPESTWQRLGRGSFGCVFKGLYLGLEVAIKEVLNSDEYDVDKYFKRECTLMKECRHPNIVQFIGLSLAPPPPPDYIPPMQFEQAGTAVERRDGIVTKPPAARRRILIISEFLPNGNLRSHIANPKLDFSWRLRLSFSVDISRAMAYLHARNCMHRDLKGENLLIAENDRIKVCDFGFARIAARNEEEMRRMSYCGTDGYMSPEILVGDDFSIETDIFSLGVIFCEIISRKLVDDYTFKRVMPTFGLDPDEIRQHASPGCPPAFIELAIACVAIAPQERPKIRTILEQLMLIEREIIQSQTSEGYNVGSLTFGAKHAGRQTKSRGLKRPQPGRIPSFKGEVNPKYSERGAVEDGNSSSDEDVEETLGKLEKLRVGGKGSVYLHAEGVQATSRLVDTPAEGDKGSTYTVIKGSKLGGTKSSFFTPPDTTKSSSIMTVKAPPAIASIFSDGSNLPSLPASWLEPTTNNAKASSPVDEVVLGDKATLGLADPSDDKVTSDVAEPDEIAGTPATIMPGSMPDSKFATIKSLSTPIAISSDILDTSFFSLDNAGPSPHRFTLIKPGWRALWEPSSVEGKAMHKRQSRSVDVSKRVSLDADSSSAGPRKSFDSERPGYAGGIAAAILPVQLLSTGLLTKCHMCEKRLGLMKPYLSCDDCQRVYHVRCGDTVSTDCGGYHSASPSQHEMAALAKETKGESKEKQRKGKRESRKLSKNSPTSSALAF